MKAAIARGKSPPAAPPATPAVNSPGAGRIPKPPAAKPSKPRPAAAELPRTEFKCGHHVSHPAKVDTICPACVSKRRTERTQKRQLKGRLPHKSRFEVEYDATTTTWTGTLSVPTADGVVKLGATEGAVFRLLSTLDTMLRARRFDISPSQQATADEILRIHEDAPGGSPDGERHDATDAQLIADVDAPSHLPSGQGPEDCEG